MYLYNIDIPGVIHNVIKELAINSSLYVFKKTEVNRY